MTNLDFDSFLFTDFQTLHADKNCKKVPFLKKVLSPIIISINMNNVESLTSANIVASALLLREVSGVRPYIVAVKTFQSFSERRLTVNMHSLCAAHNMFNMLSTLSGGILPFVSKRDRLITIIRCHGFYVLFFCFKSLRFLKTVEVHPVFFK